MTLVAGIDSSTQSCKVVVRDADSGEPVRSGRAAHPDGTEVDPASWEEALTAAVRDAGGLDDVAALAVAGQQHGMVTLDEDGGLVRDALLWNDTRSAQDARDLIEELGGGQAWADAVGTVPVASMTVTKLRWLARVEPEAAKRVASVILPHDYLTWEQIAELHREGFEIGNHTRDHMGLSKANLPKVKEQVEAINAQCAAHGIPAPTSFAYPGNTIDPDAISILAELGFRFARRGGAPEYPHYTRPPVHRGWTVPDVLLSGDHEKVREWRLERSRERARTFAEQERSAAPGTE